MLINVIFLENIFLIAILLYLLTRYRSSVNYPMILPVSQVVFKVWLFTPSIQLVLKFIPELIHQCLFVHLKINILSSLIFIRIYLPLKCLCINLRQILSKFLLLILRRGVMHDSSLNYFIFVLIPVLFPFHFFLSIIFIMLMHDVILSEFLLFQMIQISLLI